MSLNVSTSKEHMAMLTNAAQDIRFNVIDMVYKAQSGHISPGLGAADIMATLFFDVMHLDPQNPGMADRDRFVLSKGHSCPVLYATLALRGYFSDGGTEDPQAIGITAPRPSGCGIPARNRSHHWLAGDGREPGGRDGVGGQDVAQGLQGLGTPRGW